MRTGRLRMHDNLGVMTIAGRAFPAWERDKGKRVVDLRMFAEAEEGEEPVLTFQPEKLRAIGVEEEVIRAAEKGDVPGLLLVSPGKVFV